MANRIQAKISQWQHDLLDLGKRNRLLYYRPLARSSVEILEPDVYELFRRLDSEDGEARGLRFPQVSSRPVRQEPTEYDPTAPVRPRVEYYFSREGDLRTERSPRDQDLSLKSLEANARLFEEEQGINTLFLALGILEFTDEVTGETPRAPLVLVPVKLVRESLTEPFRLVRRDEDIDSNSTLRHLLASQHKTELPHIDRDADEPLLAYIDQIEQLVAAWNARVLPEAHLAQFQFNKMAMVEDLESHRDEAEANRFIRRISGEDVGQEVALPALPEEQLDRDIQPTNLFTVLDADSSQLTTLHRASSGQDMVVYGPPGTGKSQTIANLIAQLLFEGKKVLFVSEKLAALEVVRRRLEEVNLARYCLQLWGARTSKTTVLAELRAALAGEYADYEAAPSRASFDRLYDLRLQLNRYVDALHEPLGATNESAYTVHGRIARAASLKPLPFDPSMPSLLRDLTANRKADIEAVLDEVVQLLGDTGQLKKHPWWGAEGPFDYSLELRDDVIEALAEASDAIASRGPELARFASASGLRPPRSLDEQQAVYSLLGVVAGRPPGDHPVVSAWFVKEQATEAKAIVEGLRQLAVEHGRIAEELSATFPPAFLDLDHAALLRDLTESASHLLTPATPDVPLETAGEERQGADGALGPARADRASYLAAHCDTARKDIAELDGFVAQLHAGATQLAELLGASVRTVADCDIALQLASVVATDPRGNRGWFDQGGVVAARSLASTLKTDWERLAELEAELAPMATGSSLAALPVAELRERFARSYRTPFRVLSSQYRRDMRTVATAWQGTRKPSRAEAIRLLNLEFERRETANRLEAGAPSAAVTLGFRYRGAATEWADLHASLDSIERIAGILRGAPPAPELVTLATEGGDSLFALRRLVADLDGHAARLQELMERNEKWLVGVPGHGPAAIGSLAIEGLHEWLTPCANEAATFFAAFATVRSLARAEVGHSEAVAGLRSADWLLLLEQQAEATQSDARGLLPPGTNGVREAWADVGALVDWVSGVVDTAGDAVVDLPAFAARFSGSTSAGVDEAHQLRAGLSPAETAVQRALTLLADLFGQPSDVLRDLKAGPIDELQAWLAAHANQSVAARLQEWQRFKRLRERAPSLGLGDLFDRIVETSPAPAQLKPMVFLRLDRLWLQEAYRQVADLREFSPEEHERQITRFRQLDKELMQARARVVAQAVSQRQPRADPLAPPGSESDVLQRAVAMRRFRRSLRWLFERCASRVQELFPCFMMSPLSVASLLPFGRFEFDTVVFDEASQVRPADAIGAILRGRQVVLAGDENQLPPTSFFQVIADDQPPDDDSDEMNLGPQESILELATQRLPVAPLLWHYRSRDERLIDFSNRRFYGSDLITYPSHVARAGASDGDVGRTGVAFEYVADGAWEGSAKGNRIEAARVVDLVIEHFERHRGRRSLGVIAMGKSQEDRIREQLEERLLHHRDLESVPNRNQREPFFIKNLETVQGDERDDIIISIGYGPDANGRFLAKFGPIASTNGQRRLNVAITRARYLCTVVASFQPEHLAPKLGELKNEGPSVLYDYLRYARDGGQQPPTALATGGYDSEFEEAVAAALRERGYVVETQVGNSPVKRRETGRLSGFRVDLAVRHPDHANYYILGIECDGAMYHSSAVARDRDRLRQAILEGLGWCIHRVWSTRWIQDPEGELAAVVARIEELRKQPLRGVFTPAPIEAPPPPVVRDRAASEPPRRADVTPEPPARATVDSRDPMDTVPVYEPFTGRLAADFYAESTSRLAVLIAQVVRLEGPIHEELLRTRVARAYGLKRAGATIQGQVKMAMRDALRKELLVAKGSFLWPPGEDAVRLPRRPAPGTDARKIAHIAGEEVEAAVVVALEMWGRMVLEPLTKGVTTILGYERIGHDVRSAVEAAIARLERSGRITHGAAGYQVNQ